MHEFQALNSGPGRAPAPGMSGFLMGRLFTDDELQPPASGATPGIPPVILTYDMWQNRLAGDRSILGRVVRMDWLCALRRNLEPPPPRFKAS